MDSAAAPAIRGAADRLRDFLAVRSNLLFLAVAIVLVALHLVDFFANMLITPIGYDEGFNLQAPLNLVQGNGYATENWLDGGDKLLFDAIVSTGPVVELPVALSFLLFGTSIEAARIVMLPFLALLAVCLYILGKRFAGRWAGLAAVAALLALNTRRDWPNTVIYGPSDALGEYAAAALLALALVLLPRYRAWSGLAVGAAALAKFIAFMAAPAFVIALLFVPVVGAAILSKRRRVREVLVFLVLTAVPSALWELVKFVSLGPAGYIDSLVGYLRFVFRSGSGVGGGYHGFFLDRLSRLFAAWHLPTLLVIVFAVVLFAVALIGVSRYWAGTPEAARWQPGSRLRALPGIIRRVPIEVWAAAGTLAIFTLWWSFISTSIFIRHTMPVLLLAVPLVVALAVRGALWLVGQDRARWRRAGIVFVAGLAVVTTVQASFTVASSFRAEDWTRSQQVQAADFVRSLGVDEVQGLGWWAAPEIRFLSHVPSTPVGTGTGPLVLEPILKVLDPASYQRALGLCVDILYDEDGFVVCTLDPDQGRSDIGT